MGVHNDTLSFKVMGSSRNTTSKEIRFYKQHHFNRNKVLQVFLRCGFLNVDLA
jgi:hypothetical protein